MANNIKIVGIDLDGTLLRDDQSVSERNKQALKKCLNQGILVYFVSGRPYCFAKHIALQIDPRIQVISSNGGIYDLGNRCIQHPIEEKTLLEVIDVLQETGMKAFFKGRNLFYTHEMYDKRFLYDQFNEVFEKDLRVHSYSNLSWEELKKQAKEIVKILVYHMDHEVLMCARNRIECCKNIEVTEYQSISFDITAKGINKGNIIKTVLSDTGLCKEQFMAIGDGNNDIVMFHEAGIRVGMKNASQLVKKECNYISDDYLHDGVAKAIHHFIDEA